MKWSAPSRVATLPRLRRGRRKGRARRRNRSTITGTLAFAGAVLACALPPLADALTSGRLALPPPLAPWGVALAIVFGAIGSVLVARGYGPGGAEGVEGVDDGEGGRPPA